jgi:hypothetical protein
MYAYCHKTVNIRNLPCEFHNRKKVGMGFNELNSSKGVFKKQQMLRRNPKALTIESKCT